MDRASVRVGLAVMGLGLLAARGVAQELPGLPLAGAPEQAVEKPAEKTAPAPTEDNPEATMAETTGPIAVTGGVTDIQVQRKLERLLPQYPGVRRITVEVEEGVVTLAGEVEDADTRERLRDFVRRVQGVNLVLNQTKTDSQVLSAGQLMRKRLGMIQRLVAQKWLLVVGSLLVLFASGILARIVWKFADLILTPLTNNVLLRSVLGSLLGGLVLVAGFVLALWVLGVAETVLPGLGLAGVAALAISFAFRDIAENFIASILLGTRRPFRQGDYVSVAGQEGIVRSLNTRATVLVTLDGYQVRIPNATVFKSVTVNRTASSSVRGSFLTLIPFEVSIATAQEAIKNAVSQHENVLNDPPPRVLVDSLMPEGVQLRVEFWFPTRGVDGFKLNSDVRLQAKVALQRAKITPPITTINVFQAQTGSIVPSRNAADQRKAEAAIEHDAQAARDIAENPQECSDKQAEHAMQAVDDQASNDGKNLLADAQKNE